MIISISGRKSSGKTTITNTLIKHGYIKISFADKLKQYLSIIYDIHIENFYNGVEKESILKSPLIWNKETTDILNKITNENVPYYRDYEFNTLRDAMQIVGTNILRRYDSNFHIKKTISDIDPTKNYCCDDTRFISERKALEDLGAVSIFIMRPTYQKYSNHESEINLNWAMFDKVIVNDKSEDIIRQKIEKYLETKEFKNDYIHKDGDKTFLSINAKTTYYANVILKYGKLVGNTLKIETTNQHEIYGLKELLKHDGEITLHKGIYEMYINSPYIIENLKLWNFKG